MTCNDCLHYECCSHFMIKKEEIECMKYGNSETWNCFTDKSLYIKLPCKVGDKYYCIEKTCTFGGQQTKGEYFPWWRDCEYCYNVCDREYVVIERTLFDTNSILRILQYIGNLVFLTREEAEQALKNKKE